MDEYRFCIFGVFYFEKVQYLSKANLTLHQILCQYQLVPEKLMLLIFFTVFFSRGKSYFCPKEILLKMQIEIMVTIVFIVLDFK